MSNSLITKRLDSLSKVNKTALCGLWQELFKNKPPLKMRKGLIVRVIAYRLQEQAFGGLNNTQVRRLRQLASALEANPKATVSSRPLIKPGTRLVREWKQQVHTVEADAEGFLYRGAHYESLSEIARLITGTRWSGPLFFGLKAKSSNEAKEVR
jgi:hypothetical protein